MRTLYTGLIPPKNLDGFHCPLIRIIPRSRSDPSINTMISLLPSATHLLFTSGQAVRLFFSIVDASLKNKTWLAVGKATAKEIPYPTLTPEEETAEGLANLIKDINGSFFLWPHSSLSRPVLTDFFIQNHIKYYECILYDTVSNIPDELPPLKMIDEIIFTSPSTIHGFIDAYGSIPKDKVLTPIGPVTAAALHKILNE